MIYLIYTIYIRLKFISKFISIINKYKYTIFKKKKREGGEGEENQKEDINKKEIPE